MFANDEFLRALRTKTTSAIPMKPIEVMRDGVALRLFVSDEAGVGGMVWEAAGALADWLTPRAKDLRLLELGSGTGMLGLSAALSGARHVTLTDRFDVLPLLKASVEANAAILQNVAVLELSWGEQLSKDTPTFDMIVASEVIYNGNLYDRLQSTIVALLREKNQNASVVMAFERRSSEDRWLEMMKAAFEHVSLTTVSVNKKEISILECSALK